MTLESRFVGVRGLRVHVRTGGDGDPVVLVHGLGVSGTYLAPVAEELAARGHRVYVPDLPGFGRSETPPQALSIAGLAEALRAILDALGLARPRLLANSMGCQVVAELGVRAPERLGPATLVGPTVDPHLRSFAQQAPLLLLDSLLEPVSLWPILVVDYARFGPLRLAATSRSALDDRIEEKLPRLDVPAVVVRGERDTFVSQRWVEEAAELLPQGRLVVVPGAAHAAHFSHPAAVADLLA